MNKLTTLNNIIFACMAGCGYCIGANAATDEYLIRNVRVFDGQRSVENRTVLISDGKIINSDFHGTTPISAIEVNGTGKTLLPGLIDSHVHAYQDFDLPLLFGVTTEIDMFTSVTVMQDFNSKMRHKKNYDQSDVISAGTLATAPGGHGTEYGIAIETLTKPEQAQAWVDARIAEGSHFIKIVMEKGSEKHPFSSLDLATVKALIKAAHKRHRMAVVHISSLNDAQAALDANADGLVHLFTGTTINDADLKKLVTTAKQKNAFIMPTFAVLESLAGIKAEDVLQDKRFTNLLTTSQLQALKNPYGKAENKSILQVPRISIAALNAAHVPILAGTDAGNAGTQYGISLHHELASLVNAGLSPSAALASATSVPAKAFHLNDRGRIANGYKADLLMVEGDPGKDINATRNIVSIWKDGRLVNDLRQQKLLAVSKENKAQPAALHLPADGRISLFSEEKLGSPFGAGWFPTNDERMGGKSSVSLTLSGTEPAGQPALNIDAKVQAGFAYPWAGIAFFPSNDPGQAANLSAVKKISFKVKGDGKQYNVGFYIQNNYIPITRQLKSSNEWQTVTLAFDDFKDLDPHILTMITFFAGPEIDIYHFAIADIRLLTE
ncbi:CIA30 family protein [Undibacterium sp. SXout11W]|uniref:CIA30 family protein n=1 Tax=Undibacterium sp. SXout11W TaxID=3413050 RepID=UPI003BF15F7C